MKKTIGVFGSAFDPIHLGHIDCLRQIEGEYNLIIVVPSFSHAFGKQMTDFDIRVNSVRNAITEVFDAERGDIVVRDLERTISAGKNSEPVYTFDVLSALSSEFQTDDIEFVVGPDNAAPEQWEKFYRSDEIMTRWGLRAVKERSNIRSSTIRNMVANNAPWNDIESLIPRSVSIDIINKGLYGYSQGEQLQ